jgi:hypothetical protein
MALEQRMIARYKFNKGNYKKILRKFRELANNIEEYKFEYATALYEYAKKNKIKKNMSAIRDVFYNTSASTLDSYFKIKKLYAFEKNEDILEYALDEMFRSGEGKLLKPRRSSCRKITNKVNSFSYGSYSLCGHIGLSLDDQEVVFEVDQGNRNCDQSENFFFQKAFWRIINSHDWSRGEGGYVKQQDENLSDEPYCDYWNTFYFGHKGSVGKNKKEEEHRINVAMYR